MDRFNKDDSKGRTSYLKKRSLIREALYLISDEVELDLKSLEKHRMKLINKRLTYFRKITDIENNRFYMVPDDPFSGMYMTTESLRLFWYQSKVKGIQKEIDLIDEKIEALDKG